MSTGATKVVQNNKLPMGMMGTGAVRKFKKERQISPCKDKKNCGNFCKGDCMQEIKLKGEGEMTEKGEIINEKMEIDYASMHVKTLKKMAVEKGYTGDKFDKQSLIDFLNSNLCLTQETTKPLSE